MTQYNSVNVKLSNSTLEKLKSAIKNKTGVILILSINKIGKDERLLHTLLLNYTQVSNSRKSFVNNTPANAKLSKTQISLNFSDH